MSTVSREAELGIWATERLKGAAIVIVSVWTLALVAGPLGLYLGPIGMQVGMYLSLPFWALSFPAHWLAWLLLGSETISELPLPLGIWRIEGVITSWNGSPRDATLGSELLSSGLIVCVGVLLSPLFPRVPRSIRIRLAVAFIVGLAVTWLRWTASLTSSEGLWVVSWILTYPQANILQLYHQSHHLEGLNIDHPNWSGFASASSQLTLWSFGLTLCLIYLADLVRGMVRRG